MLLPWGLWPTLETLPLGRTPPPKKMLTQNKHQPSWEAGVLRTEDLGVGLFSALRREEMGEGAASRAGVPTEGVGAQPCKERRLSEPGLPLGHPHAPPCLVPCPSPSLGAAAHRVAHGARLA